MQLSIAKLLLGNIFVKYCKDMTQTSGKIERFHAMMKRVPHYVFSIICLGVILWLTLSSHPFGDTDVLLFPGFDKVAHGIMFFGLTLCMLFDTMRVRHWQELGLPAISLICILGMGIGVGVEFLQRYMELGRGFEWIDMAADSIGAVIAAALWILFGGVLKQTEDEVF